MCSAVDLLRHNKHYIDRTIMTARKMRVNLRQPRYNSWVGLNVIMNRRGFIATLNNFPSYFLPIAEPVFPPSNMNEKKYSAACERNQVPILEKLKHYFDTVHEVLEIGSGTGQHAVFFAQHLPHLDWYTSDRDENHHAENNNSCRRESNPIPLHRPRIHASSWIRRCWCDDWI